MKECKHLHSTQLSTDSFTHMQWGEKLSDGRLFTLMAVGKPDGIYNAGPCSQFFFGRISEDDGKTWAGKLTETEGCTFLQKQQPTLLMTIPKSLKGTLPMSDSTVIAAKIRCIPI